MTISDKSWKKYIGDLRKLSDRAADLMTRYLETNDYTTSAGRQAAIAYGYALAVKYGEGAAEKACQMYDAVSATAKKRVPPAEPAAPATIEETGKAINGTLKWSQRADVVGQTIGRLVKTAGVDTTMKNAIRDGASWAWIPNGDTCPFCLTLASRGWQKASKKALKGGHAEHIHANCDCTYATSFGDVDVEGYDPDALLDQYYEAVDLSDPLFKTYGSYIPPKSRINLMRRQKYALNKEKINAQKRAAYAKRKDLKAVTIGDGSGIINTKMMNTKITDNGEVVNPMPKQEYQRLVNELSRLGVEVFAATDGDDLKYMLMFGAEGTYSDGRITHIGDVPSRGTIIEEIIHWNQSRKYGELDSYDILELCAREIEANRKLLKYKESYRLDDLDIESVAINLENWENKFKTVRGVSYDESDYRGDF